MTKFNGTEEKEVTTQSILKELIPYVWILVDEDTHGMWVYYDGETCRKALHKHVRETGHRMTHGTYDIVDIVGIK